VAMPAGVSGFEAVSFRTSDGLTIRGWLGEGGDSKKGVILLHGYRGDRGHMAGHAKFLRAAGWATLSYDARGCGESDGDVISCGWFERHDLTAAIRFMKKRGFTELACIGISQGGATILYAADSLDPAVKAVVVVSTYDNIEKAVDNRCRHYVGLPGWLAASLLLPFAEGELGVTRDRLDPAAGISRVDRPVFVVSGSDDTRTLAEDTRRLFAAAREPKRLWLIPGADHEDLHTYAGAEYERRVTEFLGSCEFEVVSRK
jgi:uncharacterized protein